MSLVAGVDVGGTNLRIGVVNGLAIAYEERIHADFTGICNDNPPDIAFSRIIEITGSLLIKVLQQFPQIHSVGIGFPGFINPKNGHVAQSPNLPGLKDVDLAGELGRIIGKPVLIENDALAAAYGEYRLNGIQTGSLIYIGLGTGVGGGLILAGRPLVGEHGVAMEIGHLIVESQGRKCGCGNLGCLEQYASATGVSISYAQSNGSSELIDAEQIALLAKAGDQHAQASYALAGAMLGQALAHILKVVDVSQVVIGGGLSLSWPLMQPAFELRLQSDLIPVLRGKLNIGLSATADRAGIVGAALLSAAASNSV